MKKICICLLMTIFLVGYTKKEIYTSSSIDSASSSLSRLSNNNSVSLTSLNKISNSSSNSDSSNQEELIGAVAKSSNEIGEPTYFANPMSGPGANADPYVIRINNTYYGLCTYDNDGNQSIRVYQALHLQDLFMVTPTTIFTAQEGSDYSRELWAPEIYYLQGHWYIYFSAAGNDTNKNHVLVGGTNPNNPLDGEYIYKAKIYSPGWSIDSGIITIDNQDYFLSSSTRNDSQSWNGQKLTIAKMTNPWTIDQSTFSTITTPEYSWEKQGAEVTEAPQALYKNDQIMIVYSGSAAYHAGYCLGLLTYNGGNPLQSSSWIKKSQPVFKQSTTVWGVGHNSFTTSPDGQEDWLVYHAKINKEDDYIRNIRAQKFTWDNNIPIFGEPVEAGEMIISPSGSTTNRLVYEAELGNVGGNAIIVDSPLSSGNKAVGYLDEIGDYIEVDNILINQSGMYRLTILFHNGSGSTQYKSLYINNHFINQLDFNYTEFFWSNRAKVVEVSLLQGTNSIRISRDIGDTYWTDIDCFIIEFSSSSLSTSEELQFILDYMDNLDTCSDFTEATYVQEYYDNELTEEEQAIFDNTICAENPLCTMGEKLAYMHHLLGVDNSEEAGLNSLVEIIDSNGKIAVALMVVGVIGLTSILGYYLVLKKKYIA